MTLTKPTKSVKTPIRNKSMSKTKYKNILKPVIATLLATTMLASCVPNNKELTNKQIVELKELEKQKLSSASATVDLTILGADISSTVVKLKPSNYSKLPDKSRNTEIETKKDIDDYMVTNVEQLSNLQQLQYYPFDVERVKQMSQIITGVQNAVKDRKVTEREYSLLKDYTLSMGYKVVMNAQLNATQSKTESYTDKESAKKTLILSNYPMLKAKELTIALDVLLTTNKILGKGEKEQSKVVYGLTKQLDKDVVNIGCGKDSCTRPLKELKNLNSRLQDLIKPANQTGKPDYEALQGVLNDLKDIEDRNVKLSYDFTVEPKTVYQKAVTETLENIQILNGATDNR